MEPDHFSYRIYAVQMNHMPAAIFNLRLRQASRMFEWISLPTVFTESPSDFFDVFYSGNVVVALAFDWLGRNLYIADQSSRSLNVLRDNYYYPSLLRENVNITSLTVDALRRKLFWSVYDNGKSQLVQLDLDGDNECVIYETNANINQTQISYANNTVLFLEQPTNRIGEISLKDLPPFKNCEKPSVQFHQLAVENITQFAVYQRLTLLISSPNTDNTIQVSHSMGERMEAPIQIRKMPMSSTGRGPIKSMVVVNPYLYDSAAGNNSEEANPSNLCKLFSILNFLLICNFDFS